VSVLRVKKWAEFQHYRDRAPTWIKLYNRLLDDYAFIQLPEAAQAQLVKLWLLASRNDNQIPDDPAFISRAIHSGSRLHVDTLITAGFLERVEPDAPATTADPEPIASGPLAGAEQDASATLAQPEHNASPRARGRALARERGREEREKRQREERSGADAPGRTAVVPPPSWVAEGVVLWQGRVGAVTHGRFGKHLAPLVERHGWAATRAGLEEYLDVRKPPHKVEWFVENAEQWIRQAAEPLVVNGELTSRAQRIGA
jgi:hypothetical protein